MPEKNKEDLQSGAEKEKKEQKEGAVISITEKETKMRRKIKESMIKESSKKKGVE